MIHAEQAASKGRFDVNSLSAPGVAILLADDLTATEKLALVGLVQLDGDGRGCWPSNAEIARVCAFKANDFRAVVTSMLRRLAAKGYIAVQPFPRTADNRTGRVLHVLPKAMGGERGR